MTPPYHSELFWGGTDDGVLMEVRDADGVSVEHLNIPGHRIAQTATAIRVLGGGIGTVRFDRLMGPSEPLTTAAQGRRGLVVQNLSEGETVVVGRICMSLWASNSGNGVIVADIVDAYPVGADGAQRTTGFFGVNAANGGVIVRNNHDFVVGNLYMEQSGDWGKIGPTYNTCMVEGEPQDSPGHVTIGVARGHIVDSDSIARLHGFKGVFYLGQGDLGANDAPAGQPAANGYVLATTGNQPATVVFCANYLDDSKGSDQVRFALNSESRLVSLGNKYLDDAVPSGGLDKAAESLDHFAELSRHYLRQFYGVVSESSTRHRQIPGPTASGRAKSEERALPMVFDLHGRVCRTAGDSREPASGVYVLQLGDGSRMVDCQGMGLRKQMRGRP